MLLYLLIYCLTSSPTEITVTKQETVNDCPCNFNTFGEKTIDKTRHIYVKGKGFNSSKKSCSWSWGELIHNIVPPEHIEVQKIHLLDLESFTVPAGNSVYGKGSIAKFVIAIETYDKNKEHSKCVFDPFKTSKYKKPVHQVN